MSDLTEVFSVPELRSCVNILHEKIHPNVVFFCLYQCRKHKKLTGAWPDVNCNELDMLIMYYMTQRRQAQIEALLELKNILAKNQNTPLTFDDAVKLSKVLEKINEHHINWKAVPITEIALCEIIELAACGYQHQSQVA